MQSITKKVAKKLVSKVKVKRMPSSRGFILYRGPSMLDGSPIVVVATMKTANPKTGDMVQTFILVDEMTPIEASKQGKDTANCGNCRLRWNLDGPCYVNLGQAPTSVYKAFERGIYPVYDAELHSQYFTSRYLRMGAYGDPAAVPVEVWEHIISITQGRTGYTHQIMHKGFNKQFIGICQISADSPKQALKYQAMGAKTFRVAKEGDGLLEGEIQCPADTHGTQCKDCLLCDGTQANVAVLVHGSRASRFKSTILRGGNTQATVDTSIIAVG
jgi:hypothetical protein